EPAAPPRAWWTGSRRTFAAGLAVVAPLACSFLLALVGRGFPAVGAAQSGWLASDGSGARVAAATAPAAASDSKAPHPAKAHIPSAMGLPVTPDAPPGHRVFVDGRAAGQTPQSILVKCGAARVRIGSAGRARVVDVPCGQEIDVSKP